ncbi:hypothetical protein NDU88_001084 [Pleurodeles waltl]|uniref:Uncharacterized protein n=1 Tax=Pleurodeles waltl TaxID=8319 RepID=A0AAV7SZG3_PLEWA|nr:hypothetical protein NDU88_001084 [Pleurodeles waltl]
MGSPSLSEILKERQKAMEAPASFGSQDPDSYKPTQEEPELSGSELESDLSRSPDKVGPNDGSNERKKPKETDVKVEEMRTELYDNLRDLQETKQKNRSE